MMKLTTLACSLTIAGTVALAAQSNESTTKTKVEVKDGKEMMVTGCVEAGATGGYVLTHVAGQSGALHSYVLVSGDDNFSKVVGHRVQIEGNVADRGDGKVVIKSETKVDGPASDTHAKTEGAGPYLGVKHMKSIATACP